MSGDALGDLRQELDRVDRDLVDRFERRMELSMRIAERKKGLGLPVRDEAREALVLASRAAMLRDERWAGAVRQLYGLLMALSREAQAEALAKEGTEA